MTRAWFRVLPLIAIVPFACARQAKSPVNTAALPGQKPAEPPPLTGGPSWEPPATALGVHIDASLSCRERVVETLETTVKRCVASHPPEARVDGELDAKGLPLVKPLSLAQGHCYQLWVTLDPGIGDAQFAFVDARGHFAATSDAPAPIPTLTTRSLAVPHNGALCIDSPTELSLSAAAGNGSGKFQATLHRLK